MYVFELEISAPLLFGENDPREGAKYEMLKVGYEYDKGDEKQGHFPDGSGYPGSPPSLDVKYVNWENSENETFDLLPILYCVPEIMDTLETMGWEYLD